jgi:hypothetical protein
LHTERGKGYWRKLFGNSSAPGWLQYTTTFIALAALALSGLSLYLQRKDKRPRLRVTREESYFANQVHLESCRVVNDGRVAVQVVAIHLITSHGNEIPLSPLPENLRPHAAEGEQSLPYWIQPVERARFSVVRNELNQKLRSAGYRGHTNFKLAVVDGLGNKYTVNNAMVVIQPGPYA